MPVCHGSCQVLVHGGGPQGIELANGHHYLQLTNHRPFPLHCTPIPFTMPRRCPPTNPCHCRGRRRHPRRHRSQPQREVPLIVVLPRIDVGERGYGHGRH
jgi:hypothetical protein